MDDLSGEILDSQGVIAARREELQAMKQLPLYEIVDVRECWENTQRDPISTKWVDIDKGGAGDHKYRSRWVARDFNDGLGEFFAAAPPWEAMQCFMALAASQRPAQRNT